MSLRVLYIGGTGNISTACVEMSLARGHAVSLLNRGRSEHAFEGAVERVHGDRNDQALLRQVAARGPYDVIVNFLGFNTSQLESDIAAFSGRVGQYVFISSASVYQKPPEHYLITEATPLRNPFWEYARHKIACEELLWHSHAAQAFPMTIVRPSYTYGPTWIPAAIGGHGYTLVDRIRKGRPIVSHGDGSSLWVVTHASDFARGLLGLFGQPRALGESFHITSDEVFNWDQIYRALGSAAGRSPEIVHVPSDFIAAVEPAFAGTLLGDKAHSVVFDNSKIKRFVPDFRATVGLAEGLARSLAWYDFDASRQVVDREADERLDRIVRLHRRGLVSEAAS
ncbi:MAG TPA: NAD-dependent epimerase/dehydratase family protein [Vicinamibacteria bacterium]|nr:NAD-dependent epimerase/dehydratase family protein [Vicinamibacteria bacterium]